MARSRSIASLRSRIHRSRPLPHPTDRLQSGDGPYIYPYFSGGWSMRPLLARPFTMFRHCISTFLETKIGENTSLLGRNLDPTRC